MTTDTWQLKKVAAHPLFRLYWTASVVDAIASGIWIALLYWIASNTASPIIGALIIAAGVVPALLLAPVGGVLTDHLGQGRVVVVTTALRTLILIGWWVSTTAGHESLLILALAALLFDGVSGLHHPAVTVYMASFLPPEAAPAARSAEATGQRIAQLIGVAIGGVALTTVDARHLVTTMAVVASLLATLLFVLVRRSAHDRTDDTSRQAVAEEPFRSRFSRGLSIITTHPVIGRTIPAQTIASGLVEGSVVAGIPFLIAHSDLPVKVFPWAMTGFFVGLFAGSLLIGFVVHRIHHAPRTGLSAFGAAGVCVTLIGVLGDSFWPGTVLLSALSGGFMATGGTCLTGWTMQQVQNDAERSGQAVLGRFGAVISIAKQSDRVGVLLVGAAATLIGVTSAIVITGITLILVIWWTLLPRAVRDA